MIEIGVAWNMAWQNSQLIIVMLGLWGLSCLWWGRRHVRGTTLTAPWTWAVAALLAVTATELLIGASMLEDRAANALRYAAAVTTLCPLMALLGAKRPQDRAWQFIVLSLWAILALPAAEAVFLGEGRTLNVHGARSWFLLILILIGLFNSLGTRFWLAGCLLALAQSALLLDFLPLPRLEMPTLAGLALLTAATTLAVWRLARRPPALHPLDRLWLDFRDQFGALWGLRVAERVNASAAMYQWDIALTWSGFRHSDQQATLDDLPPQTVKVLHQNLQNLLRRFVSRQWIACRLGSELSSTQAAAARRQAADGQSEPSGQQRDDS